MPPHQMSLVQMIKLLYQDCMGKIKDLSNKQIIHETSKPFGLITTFTSQGDNISVLTDVGNGTKLQVFHEIGDDATKTKYIDFNIKENRTDIHEGYIIWSEANFDQISLEIVPTVTNYSSGSNTNFNLYGGYLIIPAAGDGTIQVETADIRLIEMPLTESTKVRPSSFWNADYNATTHTFENISPAPAGNGVYNMYGLEVVMFKLVNKMLLSDNGFLMLQTADSKQMGHGMRLKLTSYTNNGDHEWKAACVLTLHREKSA